MIGFVRTLMAMVCLACTAGVAPAQSGGDGGSAPGEAHGWVLLPRPAEEGGAFLVHLPPRVAPPLGVEPGITRLSRRLEREPAAIAASGRRIYLAFNGEPSRLLSMVVVPTPVAGMWQDRPQGRLETLAALPEGAIVRSLAADATTVWAMADAAPGDGGVAAADGAGKDSLLRLMDGDWQPVDAPPGPGDGSRRLLLGDGESPVAIVDVCDADDCEAVLWTWNDAEGWLRETIPLDAGDRVLGLLRGSVVAVAGARGDTRELVTVGPGGRAAVGAVRVSMVDGEAGRAVAATVIPDRSGRAVFVREVPGEAGAPVGHAIVEVSLSTGAILYDGPIDRVMPISAAEFRLLVVGMVLIMVVSLFVVLRPAEGTAIALPEGLALATPGVRFAACVLDLAVSILIVSRVTGHGFGQIASMTVLLEPGDAWLSLPGVLVAGFVYGTLSEALIGGTIGKLMLGCRVARVRPGTGTTPARIGRVGLGGAAVRNLVKWTLPPVASLALIEPEGRHRGDLVARTVVVTRAR